MGKTFKRIDGESLVDFQKRIAAIQASESRAASGRAFRLGRPKGPRPRAKRKAEPDRRSADHVDGYDRDDLGESPDF